MEGKEQRFGVMNSVLFAVATTGTSCGAVNSMHDSFTPLAGLAPLWNLMLGCIVFGGVGAGLYGILMHVLIAVFIAGLMIGRTPEYLGKKIQAWDATWAVIAILAFPAFSFWLGSAVACSVPAGLAGLGNPRSARVERNPLRLRIPAANNGSAFAGLERQHHFLQSDPWRIRCFSAGSSSRWPCWRSPAASPRKKPSSFAGNFADQQPYVRLACYLA
jgi:K+-transporting ATPase ATPase A chain